MPSGGVGIGLRGLALSKSDVCPVASLAGSAATTVQVTTTPMNTDHSVLWFNVRPDFMSFSPIDGGAHTDSMI